MWFLFCKGTKGLVFTKVPSSVEALEAMLWNARTPPRLPPHPRLPVAGLRGGDRGQTDNSLTSSPCVGFPPSWFKGLLLT